MVDSSLRVCRALLKSLLSIAEMSRFLRLEDPLANDASQGLDFDCGGGDRTTCCTSTRVVLPVPDLEKLLSRIEGSVDLVGNSTPSEPESSTTHCQDPYSRFDRGSPSNVVVPMTILALIPLVMSRDRLARKQTF